MLKVGGVVWAESETEVSSSKGRVLCARNIPTSFTYSRLVDIFNQFSAGQVRIVTHLLIVHCKYRRCMVERIIHRIAAFLLPAIDSG